MFDIELPEVFTGDDGQDFRQWIRRFEVAVEVVPDASSHMHVLLPTRLAGSAFTVWESMPQARQNDFQEVKKILSAMFGRSGSPNTFQAFSNANIHRQSNEFIHSDVFPAAYIKQDHSVTSQPSSEEKEPQVAATRKICDVLQQVLVCLERVEEKLERLQQSHQQPRLIPSSPLRHPHSESATSPSPQKHPPKLQSPSSPPIMVCSVSSAELPTCTSTSKGTQTTLDQSPHEAPRNSHPASKSLYGLQPKILVRHQKEDEEIGHIRQILANNLKPTPKEIRRHHPRMRRYLW